MSKTVTFLLLCVLLSECTGKRLSNTGTTQYQLFKKVLPEHSGIRFENTISETKYLNAIIYDNMLNGAGVGLLDVNNDGLLDIFFAGNQVQDKLYLNKGKMKFEDITLDAGIVPKDTWSAGVIIADVNGDDWDDIYICKFVFDDPVKLQNLYYENQRNGTFRERGKELNIADAGYSTTANFFDFDLDGDLDLYVGNQPPGSRYERPKYHGRIDYRFTDRLYRNDGNRFVDITDAAGITNYAYTLSVNTSDFNGDMLPDVYVACDYEEPDYMYINQGDGTFKNVIHEAMGHISNFSMGTDIADVNNDGFLDIFVADMVAEDHFRNKTNMSAMNTKKFWLLANNGFHYQYMFNTLQLNNGNGRYSEIAQLAGVSHTDWSWAALFLDADQDGWKDLFVANGQIKDVRNRDFIKKRKLILEQRMGEEDMHPVIFEISEMAPTKRLKNYFLRNNGDLTFQEISDEWGFTDETWSQGAAYGDLDNDGDMDLVISNSNDPAFLYENQVNDLRINNYITIRVEGPGKNTRGINTKVTVTHSGGKMVADITGIRGYMSSVQPVAHFGLGSSQLVEEVYVEWPDGHTLTMQNVSANQTVVARYTESSEKAPEKTQIKPMFEEVKNPQMLTYPENTYDDYVREVLLPYQLSTLGPAVAKGDVNGDGLEDVYIGGATGNAGTLFIQTEEGTFLLAETPAFVRDAAYEDGCATFFDADGDKDTDLYVCSGSNEFDEDSDLYQDRLYLNDGSGKYSKSDALPQIVASTSVAVPMDFDSDGDMDVFVGARQIPKKYGRTPRSVLLQNTNGRYEDIGPSALPDEGKIGMVTDASWIEAIAARSQLVLTGEWMPIRIFQWEEDKFDEYFMPGLENSEGMWNRLVVVDIDADGDLDLVAGNCGKNLKYSADAEKPFKMLVNDFDNNGTSDVYLGYYDKFDGQCYPVRGLECSSEQMPFVKSKFASYADFANATLADVLEGKMKGAQELNAKIFASGIFENVDGAFEFRPFRNEAQFAPIFGIVISDFNADGKPDIFLAGNYYNREVETTRSDAGMGNLLLSTEGLNFEYVHPSKTGILAFRDVRNVLFLKRKSDSVLLIANNNSEMQFYKPTGGGDTKVIQ